MPWSTAVATSSGPYSSENGQLVLFNLAAAAADSVVNAPSSPVRGTYFGVQIVGAANGFKLDLKSGVTVLYTLNVDDETVWLMYSGSAWVVIDHRVPSPSFVARLSPLGAWAADGSDANLTDLSGNGKTLTKSGTQYPAEGIRSDQLSGSFGRLWTRTDNTFLLTAACTIEMLVRATYNIASSGNVLSYGTGTGGSTGNQPYKITQDVGSPSGAAWWRFTSMSGANVAANLAWNAYCDFAWQHIAVTRSAPSAGSCTVKLFLNGIQTNTGSMTQPTDGSSGGAAFTVGGSSNYNFQCLSIFNSELSAAQVAYLARMRMGKPV